MTEISGRGVGLDVVRSVAQEVGGSVRVASELGRGTSFHLQLPITLSVIRAVVVEIAGEPYAFPLTAHRADRRACRARRCAGLENQHLLHPRRARPSAWSRRTQVLELPPSRPRPATSSARSCSAIAASATACWSTASSASTTWWCAPLDPRLGKVADLTRGRDPDDGSPVLILDVEDLVRSIDKLLHGGRLAGDLAPAGRRAAPRPSASWSSTTRSRCARWSGSS